MLPAALELGCPCGLGQPSGMAVLWGVTRAEGTSPNPTGNGAALVYLEMHSSPGVAIALHKEHRRTSSPWCCVANKSPATSSALCSPLLSTIPTPTAICSQFLMCFVPAPPAHARTWMVLISMLWKEQETLAAQFTQHMGTETPFAVCLSHCIPFSLGELSISNELFTDDNYLWKSGGIHPGSLY